jgi:uncharacterized DUF497 family protein
VSFEKAETVFGDPAALDWHDLEHSDLEYRCKRLGLSIAGRILIVAYAPKELEDGKETIRISARRASRKERQAYP